MTLYALFRWLIRYADQNLKGSEGSDAAYHAASHNSVSSQQNRPMNISWYGSPASQLTYVDCQLCIFLFVQRRLSVWFVLAAAFHTDDVMAAAQ